MQSIEILIVIAGKKQFRHRGRSLRYSVARTVSILPRVARNRRRIEIRPHRPATAAAGRPQFCYTPLKKSGGGKEKAAPRQILCVAPLLVFRQTKNEITRRFSSSALCDHDRSRSG
jgi:hypothetical protein